MIPNRPLTSDGVEYKLGMPLYDSHHMPLNLLDPNIIIDRGIWLIEYNVITRNAVSIKDYFSSNDAINKFELEKRFNSLKSELAEAKYRIRGAKNTIEYIKKKIAELEIASGTPKE